ncbi:hypothetical protein COU19_01275 [Candidatus Kaiserbacteria bacterium CG10_big_fil_rev_8_21_14_0_10_56_12]|uniref:Bacterial sugar transferase domain-containing protein n=1 Tax=Candidatus Kaiserbacteria bacterium CG10_big_fil_rev_8_21_14_0_10_56_12 TaxID=1974611 RepID=A0A2H0UA78_9BACT|nr:MAG: hypothetical protein COU19_01275 [Candidatus Kaiserbacteria bacterium CG10_big_fil_rev_8_21_14_0_10_56_12]
MAFDRRETVTLLVGDFLILALSLWAALTVRNLGFPPYGYFVENLLPFIPMFLLSLAVFYTAGLYEKQTRPIRRVMGVRILGAQAVTVAITAILFFILPFNIAPKTILVLYLGISVVAEAAWRFRRMNHELKTEDRIPAAIVGTGPAVLELYEEVRENPRYLMHFIERIESDHLTREDITRAVATAITNGAEVVVVDYADPRLAGMLPELYERMANGVIFLDFALLYEEIFDRVPLEHIDAARFLEFMSTPRTVYDTTKRLFDIVSAAVGLVLASPFIVMAAVILVAQNRTAFIHQERVGRGGKTFRIIKLRSRALPYDDRGDPELQKKNHITAFGGFLRRTRIDELPQLWNVLRGDLSFIGPRPELPTIVKVYEREIPHYRMRHMIVPGVSGWAQIRDYDAPKGPADIVRTRRKLSFDLYYLKHRSFGLDLVIAIKSLRALLAFSGT